MSPRRPNHEPEHERPRMDRGAVRELRRSLEAEEGRHIGSLAGLSPRRLRWVIKKATGEELLRLLSPYTERMPGTGEARHEIRPGLVVIRRPGYDEEGNEVQEFSLTHVHQPSFLSIPLWARRRNTVKVDGKGKVLWRA